MISVRAAACVVAIATHLLKTEDRGDQLPRATFYLQVCLGYFVLTKLKVRTRQTFCELPLFRGHYTP